MIHKKAAPQKEQLFYDMSYSPEWAVPRPLFLFVVVRPETGETRLIHELRFGSVTLSGRYFLIRISYGDDE